MNELLESYAKKLALAFERSASTTGLRIFDLNQPCTVTMKNRMGQYRKHPLIGGEEFRAASAYMGKTGKLIIVFVPVDLHLASKFSFMEMGAEQARTHLEGFADHMDAMLATNFDEQVEKYKAEAKAEEQKAYIESRSDQYAESFGSW